MDLCTSKFLLQRFWTKCQNKLWRRNFVQSTYLSQNTQFQNLFLGFFWAHDVANPWSLLDPSRVILLQRLVPNCSSSRALQPSGVWLKILLRYKTIFLCKYEQSHLLCCVSVAINLWQLSDILSAALVPLK